MLSLKKKKTLLHIFFFLKMGAPSSGGPIQMFHFNPQRSGSAWRVPLQSHKHSIHPSYESEREHRDSPVEEGSGVMLTNISI